MRNICAKVRVDDRIL
ncbi:Protein of unknown function [Lactobacillus helveticus CIRM-BIA 104]|uniref:Uncharacterized protein n=1 Tax=Lactobacillus helveticus CIRM-BIA 104 TaxID=1226333 RepID=U6FDL3_LACHE|nr:Protein of unknown function [Lactobacillus helveticus CIRM-BIA 104]